MTEEREALVQENMWQEIIDQSKQNAEQGMYPTPNGTPCTFFEAYDHLLFAIYWTGFKLRYLLVLGMRQYRPSSAASVLWMPLVSPWRYAQSVI